MAIKSLRLRLLDEFKCAGTDCPDTCCQAWNIDIDQSTLQKWQEIGDTHPGLDLLHSFVQKKENETSFKLKLVNNRCIHFSDERLCKVQTEIGHDYIPETCRVYPRMRNNLDTRYITSLKLSCPEVTRLLMEEKREDLIVTGKGKKTASDQSVQSTLPAELASILERFIAQVMRIDKYPIHIQLLFIAKKLVEFALQSDQGTLNLAEMQKSLHGVGKQLKQLNLDVKNNNVHSTAKDMGQFWRLVYLLGRTTEKWSSDLEEHNDILFALLDSDDESEECHKEITRCIKEYRSNFFSNEPDFYQDFMRRYLQVKFFNNNFPFSPVEGNLIAGFLYCILPYAYIQLFTWTRPENTGGITKQDVIEIIYKVERKFGHTDKIYRLLFKHPFLLRLDAYYTCLAYV